MSQQKPSLDAILARVSGGDNIRFYQDFDGGQWVELSSGWLFKKKTKHRLDPNDMMTVRNSIKSRTGRS